MGDRHGFLLINKPVHVTSFYCVKHIRSLMSKKTKVGHAGTLDPLASGLLIIAIGRSATKQLGTLANLSKTYVAHAKLGELTDTLDATGTMVETQPVDHITRSDLQAAISTLGTSYEQIPPLYSALKHEGTPLYKLTRGQRMSHDDLHRIIANKKRTVTIHELSLLNILIPFFTYRATVSKGTYIRSLSNDIARHANTYATTHELTRTAIGDYTLDDAQELSTFQSREDVYCHLRSKL